MKKCKVILHPDAESDIELSFRWGCRAWGEENAKLWVRKLRRAIRQQLTSPPLGCPLAPESEQLGISIRHLIVGRYRALLRFEEEQSQFFTSAVRTRIPEILHSNNARKSRGADSKFRDRRTILLGNLEKFANSRCLLSSVEFS